MCNVFGGWPVSWVAALTGVDEVSYLLRALLWHPIQMFAGQRMLQRH